MTYNASKDYDFSAIRAAAKAQVNLEAEQRRLQYITGGAAQAVVYREKVREARVYYGPDPDDPLDSDTYPMLKAEIGITAVDLAGVATAVLAANDTFVAKAKLIEAAVRQAYVDIDAAASKKSTIEAAGVIDWDTLLA